MFEEGEWDEAGTSVGTTAPWGTTKRAGKGPPALSGSHQRLRLLATLRRLEGLGGVQKAPPSPTSSGSEGEEDEEGSGEEEEKPPRKRRKRKPRRTRQREEQHCLPSGAEKKGNHHQQLGNNGEAAPSESRTEPFTCRKTPGSEEGAAKEELKGPLLSRKQWRNRQKNKRRQKNKYKSLGDTSAAGGAPADVTQPPDPGEPPGSPERGSEGEAEGGRGASLRLRMEERLEAARFRFLNQQLYCRPSQEAGQLFKEDPQAFAIYHRGFAWQMDRWPEKPVQRIVRYLRHRPASLVVADFGCGDCTLARSVRNQVHCFDLEALDPRVTVCDMSQVPLEDKSVDVAVFCLALMGTNVQEILAEASRVLRMGGTLLVAEVASRFSDVRAFVGAVSALGFSLRAKDVSGSHFFSFEFCKAKPLPAKAKALPGLALRPCLYKRR